MTFSEPVEVLLAMAAVPPEHSVDCMLRGMF